MRDGLIFDVIVPVYHPDEKLDALLSSLSTQLAAPRRVILMITRDTEADENAKALALRLAGAYPFADCHFVEKASYDHAATRNLGVSLMEEGAEAFLMMTQDAVPDGNHLTERLIAALADEQVAAVYARQMADRETAVPEKLARRFNYPAESCRKTKEDIGRLGIKAFFCSNVCAMYRKAVFEETGGFEAPAIFNEDMVYASRVLEKGYAIVYEAEARVMHAHDYGLRQQFKRSFDNGASQSIHADIFRDVPPEKEGKRYVRETVRTLTRVRQGARIPYFLLQCACRYTGFQLGKHFRSLPAGMRRSCSMNRAFWDKTFLPEG